MTDIEKIAQALGGTFTGNKGYICSCPAHDDNTPSLSIDEGEHGRILVKCHAGCSQESVIAAIKERGCWPVSQSKRTSSLCIIDNHRTQPNTKIAEKNHKQQQAATIASRIWHVSRSATDSHPYLEKKGVKAITTIREISLTTLKTIIGYTPRANDQPLSEGSILVIPVKVNNIISTVELIDQEGRKSALLSGRKKDGYWATERLPAGPDFKKPILIGEGVATCLSATAATGYPAVAALSCQNLLSVAQQMRHRYPLAEIVLLADLLKDRDEPNPRAVEASEEISGKLAVPDFGPSRQPDMNDFNDLAIQNGLDSVSQCIARSLHHEEVDGSQRENDVNLLLERVVADHGVPHLPENLRLLVDLSKKDRAEFVRVRSELKKRNNEVNLGLLDKDMAFYLSNAEKNEASSASPSFPVTYPTCPIALKEKLQHFQDVLVKEEQEGKRKLAPQSTAAQIVAEALKGFFAYSNEGSCWYHYKEGYWQECRPEKFDQVVTLLLYIGTGDVGFTNSYQTGVAALIQKNGKNLLPEFPGNLIPFNNGLLDRDTKKLLPLTPDTATTWIIPFDYLPESHCPNFLNWLDHAVSGDQETIQLLRAWLNALLTGMPELQVFLHLIGPAGTGKSTFGRLAFFLVGEYNATTTTLKQLETNRFEGSNIFGKRLVAIEECDKYGGSVSVLKSMTGQDPLRLERKNKQQNSSFIYRGQTLMMSNERLATKDYTSGIERRRITVEFSRRLTLEERAAWQTRGGEEGLLHPEAPGIINWALALSYAQVREIFNKMPARTRHANLEAACYNNPVLEWMLETCLPDDQGATQVGVRQEYRGVDGETLYRNSEIWLYANYLTWCRRAGREALSSQRFSSMILDASHSYGAQVKKERKQKGTMVLGLRFRREDEMPWITKVHGSMQDTMSHKPLEMKNMQEVYTTPTLLSERTDIYPMISCGDDEDVEEEI